MVLLFLVGVAQALTLDEAREAAVAHSVDARLAAQSDRVAELQRLQAYAAFSPRLNLSANYTLNDQEVALDFASQLPEAMQELIGETEPVVVQERSYFDASLTVSQALFNASALPMVRAAGEMSDAVEADLAAVEERTRNAATHLFYGLLVSRETVRILEAARVTTGDQLALLQRQLAAGTVAPLAVKQAEVAVARSERQLANARQSLAILESNFATLTGLDPRDTLEPPAAPALAFGSLDEALAKARSERPEIVAARARLDAAQLTLRADQLRWVPTVDARFTAYYTQNTGFIDDNTRWLGVATASWSPWDGGYRLRSNQISAANVESAELALRRATERAEAEVRAAWEAQSAARAAVDAVTRELDAAEEALTLTQASFDAGLSGFLDVDRARVDRDLARISAFAERCTLELALLDLASAVGM